MEDDSNFSWLCTVRLDQFITFMARYAFSSLFFKLAVTKKAYVH